MANNVVRWEPFKEMMSLREAMDRLVQDSFIRPGLWLSPFDGDGGGVAIDVIDGKDNVIVKASVPGIKPEDIDVSVTGEVLTIKGETTSEEKIKEGSYLRQERRFGKFERTITLPTLVQADKADAKFEHGVLTLTLPKAEQVKPKSIKVKTK